MAPHFVEAIKPQIVTEKSKAILTCKVEGSPVPNVKWFIGEEEIKPTSTRKLSFNPVTGISTLEILETTEEDTAIFKVKADNRFGKAECRANLIVSKAVTVTQPIVMYAPKFIKPVQAVTAKSTEDVVIDVKFEGIPKPNIQWTRNGQEIKPSENYDIQTNENNSILRIKKKTKQKAGKYEVRVSNEKGEIKSSGTVAITDTKSEAVAPRFIKPIEPQYVSPGEVVIFETTVEAYPTATFQWYVKSVPITSTPDVRIVTQENKSILLINEITSELEGPITCRAENVAGSVTCTANVNLVDETDWEETRELEYPRFVKPLSAEVRVMDGDKVNFSCVVTGKPTPKVQWYHNDTIVKEAKDVTIYQDTEGVCTLAIAEVFPENAGEYVCKALNKLDQAICSTALVVESYEYIPDSEHLTGSEEDLLSQKVNKLWIK